jgi:hypothetical protein
MHRHDLDLIAAYASGDLEHESRARELLTSCEVCQSEYQLHLSVTSELSGLEQPMMSGAEKASLRRDLWTELRSGARTSHPSADSRAPLWYRWSAAAAGLFLVVGLVAVLAQRGPDGGFDTAGDNLTTNELDSGDGDGRISTDGQSGPESAEVDTTVAAGSGEPILPDSAPGAEGEDGAAYLAMIDRFRESPPAPISSYSSDAAANETAVCLAKAGLDDHKTIGKVDEETPYLLVVPADETFDADSPITVVDSATCEVVHVDAPPE